jgi:hypothetical protein
MPPGERSTSREPTSVPSSSCWPESNKIRTRPDGPLKRSNLRPQFFSQFITAVGGVGSWVELVFASDTSGMFGYNTRPMGI